MSESKPTEKARKQARVSELTLPLTDADLFTAAYQAGLAGSLFEVILED